jgi:3',5'-cyclic AMP phosphodiesterase CpdA
MRLLALCLILLLDLPAPALADTCAGRGIVFEDANGNGRQDAREPGLPGLQVSDGEHIVRTDAAGEYRLATTSGHSIFLIKPAGFSVALRKDGLPDTWDNVQTTAGPALRYGGMPVAASACRNFALRREVADKDAALDVLVFGDPQPKSMLDIDYYQRDIVAPLRGRQHARLGLSLGDIVNDDLSLYPALKKVDATLGLPWLHAPGNHDIDFDASSDERSLDSFRHAFGPDSYAWEETQANFVVLDDVIYRPGMTPAYVGGLREQQFAFLQAYLATAPKQRLLVLALHIPLFDVAGVETFRHADRDKLFALLQSFPNVLLLSAHTHGQQQYFHGPATGWHGAKPLHEYNVGAACGSYWTGTKDAEGIPSTTMNDGTPNGYAMLSIDHGEVTARWFPARAPADYQIGLHAPKVLRRGAWPGFAVYANVFMGQDDTLVESRIDQGEWTPMRHVLQPDPALQEENILDDMSAHLRSFDRLPEAAPSTHLWRASLPTNLALGNHEVTVRATIPGFGQAQEQTSYRLDDASP